MCADVCFCRSRGFRRHGTEYEKRRNLREAETNTIEGYREGRQGRARSTRARAVAVAFKEWVANPCYGRQTNKHRKR